MPTLFISDLHLDDARPAMTALFADFTRTRLFEPLGMRSTSWRDDRTRIVKDRATAYNVIAHTDCVSTGSGVLPDGYGDDRLMTLPLTGDIHDMRLGVIRPKDVPLTPHGQQFVDILKRTLSDLAPSD